MTNTLEFITFPAKTEQTPQGLIVVLHGWGANAQDIASIVPFLNLPDYQFLCPDAPFPHPYSPRGRAWYDLSVENTYQGLTQSREILINWMQSLETTTGIPLSQTILAGFSQGGAMTLDVGFKLPLAGLIVMSGYLHPGAANDETLKLKSFPPVLITHGRQDTVVPLPAAHNLRNTLTVLGIAPQYHEFDMGHEIQLEVLDLLRSFIVNTLDKQ